MVKSTGKPAAEPKGQGITAKPAAKPVVTAKATSGPLAARVAQLAEGLNEEPSAFKRDLTPAPESDVEPYAAPEAEATPATNPLPTATERRAMAVAQGYTGNSCSECGNFTMVRNGTCEKCDTCGATSGCS